MFSIALRHDEHTRKYRVAASQPSGWELTLTEDTKPTRQVHYDDWHRVERAMLTCSRDRPTHRKGLDRRLGIVPPPAYISLVRFRGFGLGSPAMPVLYEIDVDRRLVRTTCAGSVVFDQVMKHFAALERDPRRTAAMDVVLDIRTITTTPETSQLRQVAERISPAQSTLTWGRLVIVASTPEAIGIGRLFTQFAQGRFVAATVVGTLGEAERWLQESSFEATGT